MALELVRENIECEQLLGENFADTIIKAEYVIPDTHPDVIEILTLDAKPFITLKEVMQDKIYVEGQVEYTILYLAKEDEKYGVFSAAYTGKFSNNIELEGAAHKMLCEAECYIEHMECSIANERKIVIEGIFKLKAEVYKNYNFQIIKDITGSENMQFLKKPASIDKVVGTIEGNLPVKSNMLVPMDKAQIGKVLNCEVYPHKQEVRVLDGRIEVSAFAHVKLLYRGKETRDVFCIEDDVLVTNEIEAAEINSSMNQYTDFKVESMEFNIKDDDLGESRVIDLEASIKTRSKIMAKEELETIEDAYSPDLILSMTKKNYELNIIHGQSNYESIVKGNIDVGSNPKPIEVINTTGNVCVTDKKLVEDKVVVDGLLNVNVLYKTADDDKNIYSLSEEFPFSNSIDVQGTKIDMQGIARILMENVEASVEANTIAVKAVVQTYVRVNYVTHSDFVTDIVPVEGELPEKNSSITIYVIQDGDSLWKIAKKYFTTMDNIIRINDIEDAENLKIGDKLIIPGRAII